MSRISIYRHDKLIVSGLVRKKFNARFPNLSKFLDEKIIFELTLYLENGQTQRISDGIPCHSPIIEVLLMELELRRFREGAANVGTNITILDF